jgi:dTDP-4-dehydrorhamnose reductase
MYLVLGKNGTLGSEFVRQYPDQVIGWDRSNLDITDPQAVLQKIRGLQPSAIINCIAYNAVDKAEQEPEIANLINGTAVGFLAEVANQLKIPLIHFSTNYVFAGDSPEGYSETDAPNPQSAYGKSKLLGEFEAAKALKRYTIRSAWLYGKQGPGDSSKKNFIDTMLELAAQKSDIDCVTNQIGQPTWTRDLAALAIQLLKKDEAYGLYHGTNSGSASWYNWAEEIFRIKGIKVNLHEKSFAEFNRPAHRPQYGILLSTKLRPLRPWQEALQEYLTTI